MMKRNLKALGLALVAAFAMSVVAASAAQAEGPANFTQPGEEYPVAITGHEEGDETKNFFEITPGDDPAKVHCNNVTYEGTLAGEANSLTVTPHYTECEATTKVANVDAKVDLNGCDYKFLVETKTASGGTGSVEIVCPEGEGIEVTTSVCDTHIPPQKVGGITYHNVNGDVTVTARVSGITYTETETSIFGPCDDHAEETHDGSFVSDVLVTGFEDLGTHHWITKDEKIGNTEVVGETTLETLTEGNPLDIDVG